MINEKLYNCTKFKQYKEYKSECLEEYANYSNERLAHEKFVTNCNLKINSEGDNPFNQIRTLFFSFILGFFPWIINYIHSYIEGARTMIINSKKFSEMDSVKQQEYMQMMAEAPLELIKDIFPFLLKFFILFIVVCFVLFFAITAYLKNRNFREQTMLKVKMDVINQLINNNP